MKILLTILLIGFTWNVYADDVCLTGSWYSPERDGEGINIEVDVGEKDTIVSGFFYTYVSNNPNWYVFEGVIDNLTMYTGFKLSESPFKAVVREVGVAKITYVTDNLMIYSYNLNVGPDGKPCISQCSGEYIYTRLTQPIACEAE